MQIQLTQSLDSVSKELVFEWDEEVDVIAGNDLTQAGNCSPGSLLQIQPTLWTGKQFML